MWFKNEKNRTIILSSRSISAIPTLMYRRQNEELEIDKLLKALINKCKLMTSKQDNLANIPVSDFMTRNVITISEGQTMKQASKLMYEDDIGSIVTLKEGSTTEKKEPVGIVTERDIAKTVGFAAKHSIFGDIPLSEIMSKPLTTIRPSASLKDAVTLMQQKDIRRLPIIDNDGRLAGIITEKDILRAVFKIFKETTEGKGLVSEGFDLLGFLGAE